VVNGQPQEVAPSDWPPEADIRVRLELSASQKEKRVGEIANTLSLLGEDPQLSQALDYKYKRKMTVEALKLQGFYDAEAALNPEPPKPDPAAEKMKELEVAAKEAELRHQEMNAKVAMMKAETERMQALKELDQEERKLVLEQWEKQADYTLEERKQAFNEAAAAFEKKIMEEKMRQDPESVKAIAAVDS
jgi:hypothetical protein